MAQGMGWAQQFTRWLLSILCAAAIFTTAIADKTAADYYVHALPGAPSPALRTWAGHIEVTPEHNGNMFFWLYKNRHIANRQRLVLWLNGGPGCSSMDGAMMEIGPYRVNEDKQTLRFNDGSWDEFANVLFVDNPVGTGFSYVDSNAYVTELDDMAAQMVTFLEKWFAIFPEHAQDDLYLAGESYAGQHIPYIASAILNYNSKHGNKWNLRGLLIGNGWISGPDQYPSYIKFAKANGLIAEGSSEAARLDQTQTLCDAELAKGAKDHVDNGVCEGILTEILAMTKQGDQCYNMYDTRLKDTYPSCGMSWPPDLAQVTPYLRRDDVIKALHINPDKKTGWTECNDQVGGAFRARNSRPSYKLLPELLKKVPIVLFSGDKDLICNHLGTEELINNLEWNGGKGMEIAPGTWAPRRDWTFEGEPAGIYQEARNLTYIRFFNSSHMVPFDYPRRTRDMLDRFMGVDIASIGGKPAESVIDGEKTPSTSVGGHPNSTVALEEEAAALQKATWAAYRRSAEVALLVLIIVLALWGYFFLRERRRRAGYKGLFGSDPYDGSNGDTTTLASGLGLDGFGTGRRKNRQSRDIEAAAAFDEAELDELTTPPRTSHEKFLDEEEEDAQHSRSNGRAT